MQHPRAAIGLLLLLTAPAGGAPATHGGGTRHAAWFPQVCLVVAFEQGSPGRQPMSVGTGTLIANGAAGYGAVLTAKHVIRGTTGRGVVVFPATGERLGWRLHRTHPRLDLAVLATAGYPRVRPAAVAQRPPAAGGSATCAGFAGQLNRFFAWPGRMAYPYQSGAMSHLGMAARDGDSGGPVFDARGELFGVISGSDRAADPRETVPDLCTRAIAAELAAPFVLWETSDAARRTGH